MNHITVYIDTSYKDKSYLYMRVRIDKKYVKEAFGFEINPKDWDKEKELVKASCKEYKDYNLIIVQKKALANDILIKYRLNGKELTPKIFKLELSNPTFSIDFIAFINTEMPFRKKELSDGTFRHEKTLITILSDFQKDITFSDLNETFIKRFAGYLKSVRKNGIAAQMKTLKRLKYYTDLAIKRGYIKDDPYKDYKFKSEKKLPVFLEESELRQLIELYKTETLSDVKQKVLRWYLFACLGGGMRISDLKNLKFDNLIYKKILNFSPIKPRNVNPKTVRIELPRPALRLIKDEGRLEGVIFNMYKADEVTNRVMKTVFKQAGIKRDKISFHSSRHTFAVTYLTKMKSAMAFPTLSRILGHSTVQQTLDCYVGVTQLMLDEGMKNFNDFDI